MKLLSALLFSTGCALPLAAGTTVPVENEIVYSAPPRHVQEVAHYAEDMDIQSFVSDEAADYDVEAHFRNLEEFTNEESFEGADERSLGKKKKEPVVIEVPAKKVAPVKKPIVETKYVAPVIETKHTAPVIETKYAAPSKKWRGLATLSGRRQPENESVSATNDSTAHESMANTESVMMQSEEESTSIQSAEDYTAQTVEGMDETETQEVSASETETEEERDLKKSRGYAVPVVHTPVCSSGKSCSSYHAGCSGNACSRYMQESE